MLSSDPAHLFDIFGQLILKACIAETEMELYELVTKRIPLLMPADRVSIALVTPQQDEIEVFALEGLAHDLQRGSRLPYDDTTNVGRSILTQKPHLTTASPDSPYLDLVRLSKEGITLVMCVPLPISGQTLGALNVANCQADIYGEADLSLLEQVAALISTNIDRLRLIKTTQASMERHRCQASRLERLNEMGHRLSSVVTDADVFTIVAETIEQVLKAERVSYVVPNSDGVSCQIFALMGNDVIPKAHQYPLEGSGIAAILQTGEAMAFPDLSASDYREHEMLLSQGFRMGWSVPILVTGEIVGILNAATSTIWPFPSEALTLLKALGRFMGSTIERIKAQEEVNATLQQLEHQVSHDLLTHLPNRNLFKQTLSQAIEQYQSGHLAALYLDLDGFKRINDSLSHSIGDQLLCSVAQRLTHHLHSEDLIARVGGDEFVVLFREVHSPEEAQIRTQQLLDILGQTFIIDKHRIQIGGSVGISLFPEHGQSADELMKHADIAMYIAKAKGWNNYQMYSTHMSEQQKVRLDLERDLRQAITQKEFHLVFQPQVDVNSGQIQAVETLSRWIHPQRGEIPPAVFIPIAEEMGFIGEISSWVLNESLSALASLHPRHPNLYVSVNISAHDLLNPTALTQQIETSLQQYHLTGSALELELTESVFLDHAAAVSKSIHNWKNQGIRLAIDDFGMGFSSLSYLLNLPLDTLKIDRTFVQSMHTDSRKQGVVKTILALGKNLDVICVAEGVENREQLHCLRELKCNKVQGALLAQPMIFQELESFLDKHSCQNWVASI